MQFAVTTGVRPVIERVPLIEAAQALERLRNGQARFRIVLQPHPTAQTTQYAGASANGRTSNDD